MGGPFTKLATHTDPIASEQWHKLQVKVRGEEFQCFCDGNLIVQGRDPEYRKGRVGIRARNGWAARFRNIKVTDPEGKVLWEGLPELPPGLAPKAGPD